MPNSIVLSLGCTVESPEEYEKSPVPGPQTRNSDFIGLRSCSGIEDFKGSAGNVNVQPL